MVPVAFSLLYLQISKWSDINIKLSIDIDVTNTYVCIGVYSMVYSVH